MNIEFEIVDDRRVLKQVLTKDIKQINHCRAFKGTILGNHYHKETTEYFYVLYGEAILETGWNYENKFVLEEGSIIKIDPMTLHKLTCLSNFEFMTFLTNPHTKENPDIWKK